MIGSPVLMQQGAAVFEGRASHTPCMVQVIAELVPPISIAVLFQSHTALFLLQC